MSIDLKTYGVQCGGGWRSLYEPLVDRCRAEGVAVYQIKEKFGQLRFYTGPGGSNDLNEAILAAEAASAGVCEVCGQSGYRSSRKGLVITRCGTHRT